MDWKRPKVLPSTTHHIETSCGTLHLILVKEDNKLVEIRATIGKNGVCPNVMLDTICKLTSMYLQSPEPRYKIVKKMKKQFVDMNCGQPFTYEGDNYSGCHDLIMKIVVGELEEQLGG